MNRALLTILLCSAAVARGEDAQETHHAAAH